MGDVQNKHLVHITGTVEDIVFFNEDTGFAVLMVGVDDELITVVGETQSIACGEEISASGNYTVHPTYGSQFKAEVIEHTLPATANAIYKYLASGAIKGIGPKTAERIVTLFGDDTMAVIEKTPERLTEIRGISAQKAAQISEEYKKLYGVRTVMMYLAGYGIDAAASIKIYKRYGNNAVELIKADPYVICSQEIGLPFEKAEEIAEAEGIEADSFCRVSAGVRFVLNHNAMAGHMCLPMEKLSRMTGEFLGQPSEYVVSVCAEMQDDGEIVIYNKDGRDFVYSFELFSAEKYVATRLALMLKLDCGEEEDLSKEIADIEKIQNIKYDEYQKKAIEGAVNSNVFILTGGPGTGKTTTLNGIIDLLTDRGLNVSLAAPTGRAAKRMSEVTGKKASTIHRLLEVVPNCETLTFRHNEKNPLKADVIVLDEMSMVDTTILANLLCGMRLNAKLIMVGDSDQLPSVSAGNVLKDLIDSDMIPMVHLVKVFRQAAESLIVTNAHMIVKGELPNLSKKDNDFFFLSRNTSGGLQTLVSDLCTVRLPKSYGFSPMWDIQVITPTKKGPSGTAELNRILQNSINPPSDEKSQIKYYDKILRIGDKVMQIRNNYDIICKNDSGEEIMGVFNGDIGIIENIDPESEELYVRYEDKVAGYSFESLDQVELAYAITVHKSQGNEFDAVVLPLMGGNPFLQYRNLLYTAVTRAKKLLIVCGDSSVIKKMVANDRRTLRYTCLKEMLSEEVLP